MKFHPYSLVQRLKYCTKVAAKLDMGSVAPLLAGASSKSRDVKLVLSNVGLVLSLTKILNHANPDTLSSKMVLRNVMRGRSKEYHFPKLLA